MTFPKRHAHSLHLTLLPWCLFLPSSTATTGTRRHTHAYKHTHTQNIRLPLPCTVTERHTYADLRIMLPVPSPLHTERSFPFPLPAAALPLLPRRRCSHCLGVSLRLSGTNRKRQRGWQSKNEVSCKNDERRLRNSSSFFLTSSAWGEETKWGEEKKANPKSDLRKL